MNGQSVKTAVGKRREREDGTLLVCAMKHCARETKCSFCPKNWKGVCTLKCIFISKRRRRPHSVMAKPSALQSEGPGFDPGPLPPVVLVLPRP